QNRTADRTLWGCDARAEKVRRMKNGRSRCGCGRWIFDFQLRDLWVSLRAVSTTRIDPVHLNVVLMASHRLVIERTVACSLRIAKLPGALVRIFSAVVVEPCIQVGIGSCLLSLVRDDVDHAISAGVVVRTARGLSFTGRWAPIRITDERILDVRPIDV